MKPRKLLTHSKYPVTKLMPGHRRPMYADYYYFEDLKYKWDLSHPNATREEDLKARVLIGKRCGL